MALLHYFCVVSYARRCGDRMTVLQRLLAVIVVANILTTGWVIQTTRQANEATSDYLTVLNTQPDINVAMNSPEATWVNRTTDYQATAIRVTGIGYILSVVVLIGVWISRGRRSSP